MPRSRPPLHVIEVETDRRSDRWLLWMLAGAAIGVTGGVLVAEKFSGRKPSAHTLLRRVRGLSKAALAQWGPMLDLALQVKEIWDDRQAAALEDDDEDSDDDELEDADEYEEADPPFAALDEDDDESDDDIDDDPDLVDDIDGDDDTDDLDEDDDVEDDLDDEDDEDFDDDLDEDLDDDLDEDEEEDEDAPEIGVRVLEAFSHDPVLAERAIEIEADDDGAVLLHGTVRASREVSHAVTIARGVPGVTRVRQRLTVRGRR
jgi:hypothetical protein